MKLSNENLGVGSVISVMKHSILGVVIGIGLFACGGGGGGGNGDTPPPPPPTETLSFTFDGFSEIAVGDSFEVIVQQGDDFRIDVTVDEGLGDLVAVIQEGVRLQIGFRDDFTGDIRARTLEGVVTLPVLTGIELSNSALVTMAGFAGPFLQIDLSGSSVLMGANSSFDFVSATLGGSSQLLLENVAALPGAYVELTGSSLTIVNMMPDGTLTGFGTGSSHLSYYGSSLSLDYSTSDSATVTRLGNTRP